MYKRQDDESLNEETDAAQRKHGRSGGGASGIRLDNGKFNPRDRIEYLRRPLTGKPAVFMQAPKERPRPRPLAKECPDAESVDSQQSEQKMWSRRKQRLSKKLSRILRHTGIPGTVVRKDGYFPIGDVLEAIEMKRMGVTRDEIHDVARENEKRRFQMYRVQQVKETNLEEREWIRAVQGHSLVGVEEEDLLTKLQIGGRDTPDDYFHGTYERCLESISKRGILAGWRLQKSRRCPGRKHIHIEPWYWRQPRTIARMRSSCDVALRIDVARAMRDGVPFYVAANGTILTPGVDGVLGTKYILQSMRPSQIDDFKRLKVEHPTHDCNMSTFCCNCRPEEWADSADASYSASE